MVRPSFRTIVAEPRARARRRWRVACGVATGLAAGSWLASASAEQGRVEQGRAEQGRVEQGRVEQGRAETGSPGDRERAELDVDAAPPEAPSGAGSKVPAPTGSPSRAPSTEAGEAPPMIGVGAPVASTPPPAGADAAQPSGVAAYREGLWAAAVALIEAVPLPSRSAVEQLYLARARVQLGSLVEALDDYEWLLGAPSPQLALPGFEQVRPVAEIEGAELARRLPWARVDLGFAVPDEASVFIDGRWVAPARLRAPYPVNPGWHAFLLEVRGEVVAAQRAYFEEGQERAVRLERSAPVASAARPAAPRLALAGDSVAGSDGWSTGTYAGLAVGVVGTGTGIGLATWAHAEQSRARDELNATCRGGCSPLESNRYRQRVDSAKTAAGFATAGIALGVAGFVMAAIFHFGEDDSEPTSSASLEPFVGPRSAGVFGRF